MMRGVVNDSGCALVRLKLQPATVMNSQVIEAWIDTGFTGELAIPRDLIRSWALPAGGLVRAILADGSESVATTYLAHLEWFGESRPVEVDRDRWLGAATGRAAVARLLFEGRLRGNESLYKVRDLNNACHWNCSRKHSLSHRQSVLLKEFTAC